MWDPAAVLAEGVLVEDRVIGYQCLDPDGLLRHLGIVSLVALRLNLFVLG